MHINYNRLLNLALCHNYFADGYDRFVRLSPTAETTSLLNNGKMLFKKLLHGVTVLYRAAEDEVSPFVAIENDARLVFVMTAENTARMLNVSDFDEPGGKRYTAGNLLYFRNNPSSASTNPNNPEIITHELIDSLRSSLFTYVFAIPGNPPSVHFRVTDEDGAPVSIGKSTDGAPLPATLVLSISQSSRFTRQVDLRGKPKGRYTITVLDTAETSVLKEEKIYVDDALATQNIVGVVDIVYPTAAGHLYGETEAYRIQFERAALYWKYFIVNKSRNIDFSTDSLSIADQGSINGSPYLVNDFPRAYARIGLTAKSPGQSGNAVALACAGSSGSPALALSGNSLSGGADGVAAQGSITIVNNSATGYTVSIGGVDFTEGADFSRGTTPEDTAAALLSAINAEGSVSVSAEALDYDVLVNNLQSLVFRSEQSIPVYEKPKLNIALQHLPDNQIIVTNLPNPAHGGTRKTAGDEPESEVYVYI